MYLLALVTAGIALAAAASDREPRLAVRAAGNASIPVDVNDRGLFARQYNTCPSGSGLCDTGQCCEVGHACCGYEHCVPLDSSECCT